MEHLKKGGGDGVLRNKGIMRESGSDSFVRISSEDAVVFRD